MCAGGRLRLLLAATVGLLVVFVAATSSAHSVGVSRGEYRRVPGGLEASLAFARGELAAAGGASRVAERIAVRTDTPCDVELTNVTPLERDGVRLDVVFHCREGGPMRVSLAPLLGELERGHRHEAIVTDGSSALLYGSQPELVIEATSTQKAGAPSPSFFGFVRLGVEHILTGYDHLVFLLGLVVVGLGTRRTVVVASAFTLSHSLALAACTLGAWTPPSSWVEPAIALSIVYVGIENLVAKNHERRARLAFAFGLVHGLGFASALSDAKFRGAELFLALAGFNAGVELGQLLALALLLPLVGLLLARPTFARSGVRTVSAGVAISGAVWFATRLSGLA